MKQQTLLFLLLVLLVAPARAQSETARPGFSSEANTRNRLLEEARSKAAIFERSGQLREALDQWWIVDALSPDGATAQNNIERLQSRIRSLTTDVLARGVKAKTQGKIAQAQQSFLMVLQLDPGNQDALSSLRDIETALMLKELKKYGAEGPAAPVGPTT